MNLPNRSSTALRSVLLAALLGLSACSFAKLDKRLLSDNPKTRERAMLRLKGLSPENRQKMIGPMIDALRSSDGRLANRAEEVLIAIGEPSVPEVSRQLAAPDPFLRIISTNILGEIASDPETVVPLLINGLADKHPLVREEAAHSLGRFGVKAAPAIPSLQAALADPVPDVSSAASEALSQIGSAEKPRPLDPV